MRRPLISLVCILAALGLGLWVGIYDAVIRPPEKMERDPGQQQTYRVNVNLGIAQREAGKYSKALTNFLCAHQNAPHSSRIWLTATINLAMCCEILGQDESADSIDAKRSF